jgi:hypothetical protein
MAVSKGKPEIVVSKVKPEMTFREGIKAPAKSPEPAEPALVVFPQRKRPELGRFLLQVDRQTKGSYQDSEAAEQAGLAIKTGHPILQVVVYDAIECQGKAIELPPS